MQQRYLVRAHEIAPLEIIIDLPFGFPINNIISLAAGEQTQVPPQAQENQSLPVRKNVQLGDSSPDALSQYSALYKPVEAS